MLHKIAWAQLSIAHCIDLERGKVTMRDIESAVDHRVRLSHTPTNSKGYDGTRKLFIHIATEWMRSIGCFEGPAKAESPFEPHIAAFVRYMRDERGLSPVTISTRCERLVWFFESLHPIPDSLNKITIADLDTFIESKGNQGWKRSSLSALADSLRSFFHYAEGQRWCGQGISAAIESPRLYTREGIPEGPSWENVQRLLASTAGNNPVDIRNHAILMLLASYGLRRGEVARLQLEDLHWAGERIAVSRLKQRRIQYYPLATSVGEAILRYLREVRPCCMYRAVFLTMSAPFRPLSALEFLKKMELENKRAMDNAPMEIVSRSWLRYIYAEDGSVDRQAYTFCVLDRFQDALSRREIFVPASSRYADPRIGLLDDQAWNATRLQVCRAICRSLQPEKEIEALGAQLDAAYRRVAANLPNNSDVRIEKVDGNDELVITPLDKLEEPPSCVTLRKTVASMLPRIDLPELLLEIHQLTGFADEFTHINESESRAEDLHISICAVLLAEACNIGLEPLIRPDVPALTRARLSWVQQNYIRADTLTRANARLVKAQSGIALAQEWGGGHVASVDGIRFVVPVRTINAGSNPKYFNRERGVTYFNMTSDQGTGLNGIIEPGTIRDSMLILAVVLGQQTHLEPSEIMTDTGSYTDIIFGIFWLLGYQFCPRLVDMGDARFWRIDKDADYGPLNGLACNRANVDKILANWDDMLRLAGSLKLGLLQPFNLMRTLQKGDKMTELQKALINLGRINKTIYMLNFIDDSAFRRRILTQLNTHEGRHSLARTTFYGRRGELRQRYREGQEDQLGALGLVLNIIVLWNTVYMNAAIEALRAQGVSVAPEDIARLSPFGHKHINYLGHYSFILSEIIRQGGLRPFRSMEQLLDLIDE
jgi:TnpA family transposase/site-specific recombinase XerD